MARNACLLVINFYDPEIARLLVWIHIIIDLKIDWVKQGRPQTVTLGRQHTLIHSALRHKATYQAIHCGHSCTKSGLLCTSVPPSGHPPEFHADVDMSLRLRELGKATEATEPPR
ncbi:hypothetical protein B0H14DRAFT_2652592 [Mycena olivaceomarginata]|nr:hypothetical protein B0H14DRAFT_2652592 [Mycena olivaceomarginata]